MPGQALGEDPPDRVRSLLVGLQAVGATAPGGVGLVRVGPGVTETVPVRRPPAELPALFPLRAATSCLAPVSSFPPAECREPPRHRGEHAGGKDDEARREEHRLQGCRRNKDRTEARPCRHGYLKVRHIHR